MERETVLIYTIKEKRPKHDETVCFSCFGGGWEQAVYNANDDSWYDADGDSWIANVLPDDYWFSLDDMPRFENF